MAQFTIQVPDELLPALKAEFNIMASSGHAGVSSVDEYLSSSVVDILRQHCQIHKVGPYFVGPVEPRFLADGMPNPSYTGDDAVVLPDPTASEENELGE